MGCSSSKTLTSAAGTQEEALISIKKQPSAINEALVPKNEAADQQFLTIVAKSNLDSVEPVVQEPEKPEKKMEAISAWELQAGLEEEQDEGAEEGSSKSLNSAKQRSENKGMKAVASKQESESAKGMKRKVMAAELAARKAPVLEIRRTGSLRDWLMQGGQVTPRGTYLAPKHGSFEKKVGSDGGGNCEECLFDPVLVAQLEKAMEELTMEEEEILKQIVEKWEGNVRKVF